jgi:hypothetical protein
MTDWRHAMRVLVAMGKGVLLYGVCFVYAAHLLAAGAATRGALEALEGER